MRALLLVIAAALVFVLAPIVYVLEQAAKFDHEASVGFVVIGVVAALVALFREAE